jgi:hypothetical protein
LGVVVGAAALFLLLGVAAGSENLRPWAATLAGALAVAAIAVRTSRSAPARDAVGPAVLALGLLLVCVYFVHLTLNEQENGIPLAFLALGLALLAWRPSLPPAAVAVVLVAALVDAVWFTGHFVAPRTVDQQPFREPTAAEQRALPNDLSFLRWDVPRFVHYRPSDLTAAVRYLKRAPGNFVVFGDTSILYALADQRSESPVLWYHFDLTYPRHDPALLREIEGPLDRRIDAGIVRRIVFDNPLESEATIGDFPGLAERVRTRGCGPHSFGSITVEELTCSKILPPTHGG